MYFFHSFYISFTDKKENMFKLKILNKTEELNNIKKYIVQG